MYNGITVAYEEIGPFFNFDKENKNISQLT